MLWLEHYSLKSIYPSVILQNWSFHRYSLKSLELNFNQPNTETNHVNCKHISVANHVVYTLITPVCPQKEQRV